MANKQKQTPGVRQSLKNLGQALKAKSKNSVKNINQKAKNSVKNINQKAKNSFKNIKGKAKNAAARVGASVAKLASTMKNIDKSNVKLHDNIEELSRLCGELNNNLKSAINLKKSLEKINNTIVKAAKLGETFEKLKKYDGKGIKASIVKKLKSDINSLNKTLEENKHTFDDTRENLLKNLNELPYIKEGLEKTAKEVGVDKTTDELGELFFELEQTVQAYKQ